MRTGVVNAAHELIAGQGDERAALDGLSVRFEAAVPQSGKTEQLLVGEFDQEGILLPVLHVPLIKRGGRHDATLCAAPGAAPRGGAFELLDGRIDGRILRGFALCKERNQPPAQGETGALAVLHADDGDGLTRCDVVTRRKRPARLHDGELSLDGRLIAGDKSTAHGYGGLNCLASRSRRSASWAALRASTRLPASARAIPLR